MIFAQITEESGSLAVSTSYDAGFVAALKDAVPPSSRRFENSRKIWLVSVEYGPAMVQLIQRHYSITVVLPVVATVAPSSQTCILDVVYIARCRPTSKEPEAFGWHEGEWNLLFPEPVLRNFFEGSKPDRPDDRSTLYEILLVKPDASNTEIVSAYRRLARLWHPDLNHEADAEKQFKVIQKAYEILKDGLKRRKYNAGLAFAASLPKPPEPPKPSAQQDPFGYRSPLRSGRMEVEGFERLERFVVTKILRWEDITDAEGRVLVASMRPGVMEPEVMWVSKSDLGFNFN